MNAAISAAAAAAAAQHAQLHPHTVLDGEGRTIDPNAVLEADSAADKIDFTDDGKRVLRFSASQRIMRQLRRVESLANFLDRPTFPSSPNPDLVTRTRHVFYMLLTGTESKVRLRGVMCTAEPAAAAPRFGDGRRRSHPLAHRSPLLPSSPPPPPPSPSLLHRRRPACSSPAS